MKKIIVNGKAYDSLNDLPGLLRDVMKDQNKDGIPDIAEDSIKNTTSGNTTIQNNKFIIKGREYNSWDEIPEEEKKYVEQKLENADQNLQNLQNINVHQLMSTFGGVAGYGISKLLKLPGSQGKQTPQTPKTPNDPTQNKAAHQFTQLKSNSPTPINLNSPKPGDLPGVKGKEGTRIFIFAAAIVTIIGWMIFEFAK